MTLGHAESSVQKLRLSSSTVFAWNWYVWFHKSLLTLFFQFCPRNSNHSLIQSVEPVFHALPGELNKSSQYTLASSNERAFCPFSRAQTNVCLYTLLNKSTSVDNESLAFEMYDFCLGNVSRLSKIVSSWRPKLWGQYYPKFFHPSTKPSLDISPIDGTWIISQGIKNSTPSRLMPKSSPKYFIVPSTPTMSASSLEARSPMVSFFYVQLLWRDIIQDTYCGSSQRASSRIPFLLLGQGYHFLGRSYCN